MLYARRYRYITIHMSMAMPQSLSNASKLILTGAGVYRVAIMQWECINRLDFRRHSNWLLATRSAKIDFFWRMIEKIHICVTPMQVFEQFSLKFIVRDILILRKSSKSC